MANLCPPRVAETNLQDYELLSAEHQAQLAELGVDAPYLAGLATSRQETVVETADWLVHRYGEMLTSS